MGKHIKPFLSTLHKLVEGEEQQVKQFDIDYQKESDIKENPIHAFRDEIVNRNASIDEVREKFNSVLKLALEQYNKDLKAVEKAKFNVAESYNRLITQAKEAVLEIEDLGERFENDMYELQEIIIFFTKESEKMMKLSDADLREIINIMADIDVNAVNVAIETGMRSGRLSIEKEYKTIGVSRRKPETINPDGTVKVGQRFPSQYAKQDMFIDESEYVNESIFATITNFLKGVISDIKKKLFGVDDSLDKLEMNIKRLKEIAKKI